MLSLAKQRKRELKGSSKDRSRLPRVRFNDAIDIGSVPLLVMTMHTASYRKQALRLLASCRAMGLAAVLHEVPVVHHSMSGTGTGDLSFTKATLIRSTIETYEKPVLYVDADIVFRDRPTQVEALMGNCDFAIYNWAADACNDAWMHLDVRGSTGQLIRGRFWKFSHSVDFFDPTQLICSGAVQFWGVSEASKTLLAEWQNTIANFPQVADDECLDFTFNNRKNSDLRYAWLEKSHLRYPWWPHIKPIIDHPDPVHSGPNAPRHLHEVSNQSRFHPERGQLSAPPPDAFPRWAVLDTEQGFVLKIVDNNFVPVRRAECTFWV